MAELNVDWAVGELDQFITAAKSRYDRYGYVTAAPPDEVAAQAQIVEQILARVTPNWRGSVSEDEHQPWEQRREAAIRAREVLLRRNELRTNLGDDAPEISAANLHPWVWSGASSLWQSSHYRSAVDDAAKKVNAETQNKIGRRDVSETDLFRQAFSLDPAEPGKPRLRRIAPDGSDTYKSMQRGAMALAEGLFAGIRNPLAHADPQDLDEQVALEYLAALSVLARWVDESAVEAQ